MPPVQFMFTLLLVAIISRVSYNALYRYMKMPSNYEFTLYWGIAFALLAFITFFQSIAVYALNFQNINMIFSSFVPVLIPWLMLFSALFIVYDSHNVLIRKKIRAGMYFFLLLLIIIYYIFVFTNSHSVICSVVHTQSFLLYLISFGLLFKNIEKAKQLTLGMLLFAGFHLIMIIRLFVPFSAELYMKMSEVLVTAGVLIIFLEVRKQICQGAGDKILLTVKKAIEFIKEHFFKFLSAIALLLVFILRKEQGKLLKKKAEDKAKKHKNRKEEISREKDKLDEVIEKYYEEEKLNQILKKEEEIDKLRGKIKEENLKQKEIRERIEKLRREYEKIEEESEVDKFEEGEADEAYEYLNDIIDDNSSDT